MPASGHFISTSTTELVAGQYKTGRGRDRTDRRHSCELPARVVLPLLLLVALLAIWVLIAAREPAYVLPGPLTTWQALTSLWSTDTIQPAIVRTFTEAILGWLIGLGIGLPLGYLAGRSRVVRWTIGPFLGGSYAMPLLAVAPLLLLWVGFGIELKVISAVLVVVFPIMATTTTAVEQIRQDLRDVAQVFGANWWQSLIFLEAPQAARGVLAGAKITISLAVIGAYVGEYINPDVGLGALIQQFNGSFAADAQAAEIACVIVVMALAAVLYLAVSIVEGQITRRTE